jgi:FkbM family methyltransferase
MIAKQLLQKFTSIQNIIFDPVISIQGQRIKIPLIAELRCTLTETWMIGLLEPLLKANPGTFLDIGVNLGQTLIKVKGIEPGRKYIGFEPNPACVFYAKELIKSNAFKDCTIFPVGLFTEDSVLSLECIDKADGDSAASLVKDFRPNHVIHQKILVPVFRFQSLANALNFDKVGIVKIDVEGAELEVIQTLRSMLQVDRPIVLVEVLPVYADENIARKVRQEALEQILGELDYLWFRVQKTAGDTFVSLSRIQQIGVHADLRHCDYVVVPKELETGISHLVAAVANGLAFI